MSCLPVCSTSHGAVYVDRNLRKLATAKAELTIDLTRLTPRQRNTVLRALKAGSCEGSTFTSTSFGAYAIVCKKFGLTISNITNGNYIWVAVKPDTTAVDCKAMIRDILQPLVQLTEPPGTWSENRDGQWRIFENTRMGQESLGFRAPRKVTRTVLVKKFSEYINGHNDPARIAEAIAFVNSGGTITMEMKDIK